MTDRCRRRGGPVTGAWCEVFRVEPIIAPTAVLGPLQQVSRLGRLGCRRGYYPPYCYPPPYYFDYLGRPGAKLQPAGRLIA
jgi:hypothetical protein